MVLFQPGFQTLQDLHSIIYVRGLHQHRSESAHQGGVSILHSFAVLSESGSTDDADCSTYQLRFEGIGCIQSAGGRPCTHESVHLVDE